MLSCIRLWLQGDAEHSAWKSVLLPPSVSRTHTHTQTHNDAYFILSFIQNEHNFKISIVKTLKGSRHIRAVIVDNKVSEQMENLATWDAVHQPG
jgi:hypothetical protein